MPMTSFLSTIPDKMIDNIISTILRQIIQPIGDQSTLAHTTFTSNDKMRVISSQEIVQYLKVTFYLAGILYVWLVFGGYAIVKLLF